MLYGRDMDLKHEGWVYFVSQETEKKKGFTETEDISRLRQEQNGNLM